ncbi:MAG: hypothetical protein CM1200mP36_00080 [Gammaproteobacteria bacterium]|nr:MAG: hypothetical protein CM1200mP36_00080 [Gammaproteobacteria bacterium]
MAIINAIAHVVLSEGLEAKTYIDNRCEADAYEDWRSFILDEVNSPESMESVTGVPAEKIRGAARFFAKAPNGPNFLRPRVSEHSQGFPRWLWV